MQVEFPTQVTVSPVNVTVFTPVRVLTAVKSQPVTIDEAVAEATMAVERRRWRWSGDELRRNDKSLAKKGQAHTWRITEAAVHDVRGRFFSSFRIKQTATNSNGHHYFALSGFELYGQCINRDAHGSLRAGVSVGRNWQPVSTPDTELSDVHHVHTIAGGETLVAVPLISSQAVRCVTPALVGSSISLTLDADTLPHVESFPAAQDAEFVASAARVVVFGRNLFVVGGGSARVFSLDLELGSWESIDATASEQDDDLAPPALLSPCVVVVGATLLLYGGYDVDRKPFDTRRVYAFDLLDLAWRRVAVDRPELLPEHPVPADKLAANPALIDAAALDMTASGTSAYFLAGDGNALDTLVTLRVALPTLDVSVTRDKLIGSAPVGDSPPVFPRRTLGAGLLQLSPSLVLHFGGLDLATDTCSGDLFSLDLHTRAWTKCTPELTPATGDTLACMSPSLVYAHGHLLVLGGLDVDGAALTLRLSVPVTIARGAGATSSPADVSVVPSSVVAPSRTSRVAWRTRSLGLQLDNAPHAWWAQELEHSGATSGAVVEPRLPDPAELECFRVQLLCAAASAVGVPESRAAERIAEHPEWLGTLLATALRSVQVKQERSDVLPFLAFRVLLSALPLVPPGDFVVIAAEHLAADEADALPADAASFLCKSLRLLGRRDAPPVIGELVWLYRRLLAAPLWADVALSTLLDALQDRTLQLGALAVLGGFTDTPREGAAALLKKGHVDRRADHITAIDRNMSARHSEFSGWRFGLASHTSSQARSRFKRLQQRASTSQQDGGAANSQPAPSDKNKTSAERVQPDAITVVDDVPVPVDALQDDAVVRIFDALAKLLEPQLTQLTPTLELSVVRVLDTLLALPRCLQLLCTSPHSSTIIIAFLAHAATLPLDASPHGSIGRLASQLVSVRTALQPQRTTVAAPRSLNTGAVLLDFSASACRRSQSQPDLIRGVSDSSILSDVSQGDDADLDGSDVPRGFIDFLGRDFGVDSTWANPDSVRGLVKVTSTSLLSDSQPAWAAVGRDSVRCVASPKDGNWFAFDLSASGVEVDVTAYALRHYSTWDTEALRHWVFEAQTGDDDPDSDTWHELKAHDGDAALSSAGQWHMWGLRKDDDEDGEDARWFVRFRVRMTGTNSNSNKYLALSGFEVYGRCRLPSTRPYVAPLHAVIESLHNDDDVEEAVDLPHVIEEEDGSEDDEDDEAKEMEHKSDEEVDEEEEEEEEEAEVEEQHPVLSPASAAAWRLQPSSFYSFGENSSGILGRGDNLRRRSDSTSDVPSSSTPNDTPPDVPGRVVLPGTPFSPALIAKVSVFGTHALLCTTSGECYAFGSSSGGRLGVKVTSAGSVSRPTLVKALEGKRVVDVAAGNTFSLALTDDGEMYSWGSNQHGQLGRSSDDADTPMRVQEDDDLADKHVVAVIAGAHHAMALTADGALYAWGRNNHGQLGLDQRACNAVKRAQRVPQGLLPPAGVCKVVCGWYHTLALTRRGEVYSCGNGYEGARPATGHGHCRDVFVLTRVERLVGTIVVDIAAGWDHSLAITSDGKLFTWGGNVHGCLGHKSAATATASSTPASPLPALVDLPHHHADAVIVSADGGQNHTVAVTSQGEVFTWGINSVCVGHPAPAVPAKLEHSGLGHPQDPVAGGAGVLLAAEVVCGDKVAFLRRSTHPGKGRTLPPRPVSLLSESLSPSLLPLRFAPFPTAAFVMGGEGLHAVHDARGGMDLWRSETSAPPAFTKDTLPGWQFFPGFRCEPVLGNDALSSSSSNAAPSSSSAPSSLALSAIVKRVETLSHNLDSLLALASLRDGVLAFATDGTLYMDSPTLKDLQLVPWQTSTGLSSRCGVFVRDADFVRFELEHVGDADADNLTRDDSSVACLDVQHHVEPKRGKPFLVYADTLVKLRGRAVVKPKRKRAAVPSSSTPLALTRHRSRGLPDDSEDLDALVEVQESPLPVAVQQTVRDETCTPLSVIIKRPNGSKQAPHAVAVFLLQSQVQASLVRRKFDSLTSLVEWRRCAAGGGGGGPRVALFSEFGSDVEHVLTLDNDRACKFVLVRWFRAGSGADDDVLGQPTIDCRFLGLVGVAGRKVDAQRKAEVRDEGVVSLRDVAVGGAASATVIGRECSKLPACAYGGKVARDGVELGVDGRVEVEVKELQGDVTVAFMLRNAVRVQEAQVEELAQGVEEEDEGSSEEDSSGDETSDGEEDSSDEEEEEEVDVVDVPVVIPATPSRQVLLQAGAVSLVLSHRKLELLHNDEVVASGVLDDEVALETWMQVVLLVRDTHVLVFVNGAVVVTCKTDALVATACRSCDVVTLPGASAAGFVRTIRELVVWDFALKRQHVERLWHVGVQHVLAAFRQDMTRVAREAKCAHVDRGEVVALPVTPSWPSGVLDKYMVEFEVCLPELPVLADVLVTLRDEEEVRLLQVRANGSLGVNSAWTANKRCFLEAGKVHRVKLLASPLVPRWRSTSPARQSVSLFVDDKLALSTEGVLPLYPRALRFEHAHVQHLRVRNTALLPLNVSHTEPAHPLLLQGLSLTEIQAAVGEVGDDLAAVARYSVVHASELSRLCNDARRGELAEHLARVGFAPTACREAVRRFTSDREAFEWLLATAEPVLPDGVDSYLGDAAKSTWARVPDAALAPDAVFRVRDSTVGASTDANDNVLALVHNPADLWRFVRGKEVEESAGLADVALLDVRDATQKKEEDEEEVKEERVVLLEHEDVLQHTLATRYARRAVAVVLWLMSHSNGRELVPELSLHTLAASSGVRLWLVALVRLTGLASTGKGLEANVLRQALKRSVARELKAASERAEEHVEEVLAPAWLDDVAPCLSSLLKEAMMQMLRLAAEPVATERSGDKESSVLQATHVPLALEIVSLLLDVCAHVESKALPRRVIFTPQLLRLLLGVLWADERKLSASLRAVGSKHTDEEVRLEVLNLLSRMLRLELVEVEHEHFRRLVQGMDRAFASQEKRRRFAALTKALVDVNLLLAVRQPQARRDQAASSASTDVAAPNDALLEFEFVPVDEPMKERRDGLVFFLRTLGGMLSAPMASLDAMAEVESAGMSLLGGELEGGETATLELRLKRCEFVPSVVRVDVAKGGSARVRVDGLRVDEDEWEPLCDGQVTHDDGMLALDAGDRPLRALKVRVGNKSELYALPVSCVDFYGVALMKESALHEVRMAEPLATPSSSIAATPAVAASTLAWDPTFATSPAVGRTKKLFLEFSGSTEDPSQTTSVEVRAGTGTMSMSWLCAVSSEVFSSGEVEVEFHIDSVGAGANTWKLAVGVIPDAVVQPPSDENGSACPALRGCLGGSNNNGWAYVAGTGERYTKAEQTSECSFSAEPYGDGDVVRMHLDLDSGTLAFAKNGEDLKTAFKSVRGAVRVACSMACAGAKVRLVRPNAAPQQGVAVSDVALALQVERPVSSKPSTAVALPKWFGNVREVYEMLRVIVEARVDELSEEFAHEVWLLFKELPHEKRRVVEKEEEEEEDSFGKVMAAYWSEPKKAYEADLELLALAELQARRRAKRKKKKTVQPVEELRPRRTDLVRFRHLDGVDTRTLNLRYTMLRHANALLERELPLVDLERGGVASVLGGVVCEFRDRVLWSVKRKVVDEALSVTQVQPQKVEVQVNRGVAQRFHVYEKVQVEEVAEEEVEDDEDEEDEEEQVTEVRRMWWQTVFDLPEEEVGEVVEEVEDEDEELVVAMKDGQKKCDRRGKYTVFGQVFRQLRGRPPAMFRIGKRSVAFNVTMLGEFAEDQGGPYREAIEVMCRELQSDGLPLFVPCPNRRERVGLNQHCFVPNPQATSALHVAMLEFVGQLLGLAVRTQGPMSLDWPPMIWKLLVGQAVDEDLRDVDVLVANTLANLRELDERGREAFEADKSVRELRFVATGSDQRLLELIPNGRRVAVTWENRRTFARLLREFRVHEFDLQVAAIRRGLVTVIPPSVLHLLSWSDLERGVCGEVEVDVDVLEANTVYSGCSASDTHIKFFWKVLRERFTSEDRSKFLTFLWGRSRLPHDAASQTWEPPMKIVRMYKADKDPDKFMPTSATCFMVLSLPQYSTEDVMYERLLYACTHTVSIDADDTRIARAAAQRGALDAEWVSDEDEL